MRGGRTYFALNRCCTSLAGRETFASFLLFMWLFVASHDIMGMGNNKSPDPLLAGFSDTSGQASSLLLGRSGSPASALHRWGVSREVVHYLSFSDSTVGEGEEHLFIAW